MPGFIPDTKDMTLLEFLQQDCRMSNAEMAERLGMSPSACWRRVRALEEAGIVSRYAAVVEPSALGLGFEAIVHVILTRHESENVADFIKAVQRRSEIVECYATTGQSDYQMRVLCRDIEAYNQFLETFLFKLSGVSSAQTSVILRKIKSNTPIRA